MTGRAILLRERGDDQGTPGQLYLDGRPFCYTLELPWRDNLRGLSCIIAPGSYPCALVRSPRFGRVYGVGNTPGRSHVLAHSGNWAGDIHRGYKSHVQGCILLGLRRGVLDGQRAVLVSRPALTKLINAWAGAPFLLELRNA